MNNINYLILHNKCYQLDFASATRFEIEAESIADAKEKALLIESSGHFSIFINKIEVDEFCVKRYEDTDDGIKERAEMIERETLQRIKDSSKDYTFKLALFAENLRFNFDESLGNDLDSIRKEIENYVDYL